MRSIILYFLMISQLFLPMCAFCADSSPLFPGITYYSAEETLEKIKEIIEKKEKGMYLRFGDGDVDLASGRRSDKYQKINKVLTQELQEAFCLEGETIIKTLPLNCEGYGEDSPKMCRGMKLKESYCTRLFGLAKDIWEDMEHVYSPWIIPYLALNDQKACIECIKFLRNHNCAVFVGNRNIPKDLIALLFGDNCKIIGTPSKDAYSSIERIERTCLKTIKNDGEYKIIIICMGCSGRALQKRLWKNLDNVFLFDFGSLVDALCEKRTRVWIRHGGFKAAVFMEALKKSIRG